MQGMKWRTLGLGVAGALVLAGCGTHSTKPATPSPTSKAPAVSVPPNRPAGSNAPKTLGQVQSRVNQLRQAALAKHILAPTQAAGAGVAATTKYSGNWAGYVAVSHAYTNVGSKWTVPKTTCLTESFVVLWVGIDGWSNGSVEQDGTGAYCSGKGAVPYYFAWWEMYPQNSVQITTLAVKPGDKIQAGVMYMNNNRYWLQVINSSTGQRFSTYQYKAGAYSNRNSAEWVVEAPSGDAGQYPLTQFANVAFTSDTATSSVARNAGSWPNSAIIMWTHYALASPYPLTSAGSAFTTHWSHSY